MSQINDAKQNRRAAKPFTPSPSAAGGALLIALAITACGQQEDTMDEQGEVPTSQEDTQTQQAPEHDMRQPGAGDKKRVGGGSMQKSPAAKQGSMADAPPSPEFMALDANGDGLVSAKEAKENSGLSSSFNELDMNGDGQLDKQEFAAFASGKMGGKAAGGKSSAGKQGGGQSSGSVENPNRPTD